MLPRYCKLILGTLGMSGYGQEKWQYQLAENFRVCLYAKNQIYPLHLSWNIIKILKTSQPPPKTIKSTCLSICQKSTWSVTSFLRYYRNLQLKKPVIRFAESILAHKLGTKILPDNRFAVKYKWQKPQTSPFSARFAHFLAKQNSPLEYCSYQLPNFWKN